MKAMIFAAGMGTRLRPLTDDRPKALVTIAGRTLLEIAITRIKSLGVREVIVNVHHYAEMVRDYLKANDNFGLRIEISFEENLLDTGGGLKKAAWFFLEGRADEPFLVHNVDVISNIDLSHMVQFHIHHKALATLAVQDRETSRFLLFDGQGQLCARQAGRNSPPELVRQASHTTALAFSGIHVISPRIFAKMAEEGAFSIVAAYLRLAAQSEKILCFRADEAYWRDVGRPQSVIDAAKDFASGAYNQR